MESSVCDRLRTGPYFNEKTMFQTIKTETNKRGVHRITLNRPDVHNAFNATMIEELISAFTLAGQDAAVQIIVLQSEGKSFSAGADINWMQSMVDASQEQNREDSQVLARLMRTINFCPKPVVARVQGLALGGGVGLLSCCDIVVASPAAKFGLTEAKLGLVPAVISPYVVDAIGSRHARHYFLTAELFDSQRAYELGLVSVLTGEDTLDDAVEKTIARILRTGPNARAISKKLVMSVVGRSIPQQKKLDEYTTQVIAAVRVSPEGQQGLKAFLNKQEPDWK